MRHLEKKSLCWHKWFGNSQGTKLALPFLAKIRNRRLEKVYIPEATGAKWWKWFHTILVRQGSYLILNLYKLKCPMCHKLSFPLWFSLRRKKKLLNTHLLWSFYFSLKHLIFNRKAYDGHRGCKTCLWEKNVFVLLVIIVVS